MMATTLRLLLATAGTFRALPRARPLTMLRATDDASISHANQVTRLHVEIAKKTGGGEPAAAASESDHNARQTEVFDEAAAFFASDAACPTDVHPRLEVIAGATGVSEGHFAANAGVPATQDPAVDAVEVEGRAARVVDVGCGTGALVPFLKTVCGLDEEQVVGVDLSARMLQECSKRYPGVRTEQADFSAWAEERSAAPAEGLFDAVIFNACFGNLANQSRALTAAERVVRPDGGRVLITHPLGAAFVDCLVAEDPTVVPRGLPADGEGVRALLSADTPLRVVRMENPPPSPGTDVSEDPYVCVLEHWRSRPLAEALVLRAPVAHGFGRGSRKMGVPTANLERSERLDAFLAAAVPAGVYAGWAVVEGVDGEVGRRPHPAIANVGVAPTFGDESHAGKIVEAHLMPQGNSPQFSGDFYDRPMRLVLAAFLRPERTFPGFPDLLAAIRQVPSDRAHPLAPEHRPWRAEGGAVAGKAHMFSSPPRRTSPLAGAS